MLEKLYIKKCAKCPKRSAKVAKKTQKEVILGDFWWLLGGFGCIPPTQDFDDSMGYNRGWHGLGGSGEATFPDIFLLGLPVPPKTGQNSAPEQKKAKMRSHRDLNGPQKAPKILKKWFLVPIFSATVFITFPKWPQDLKCSQKGTKM